MKNSVPCVEISKKVEEQGTPGDGNVTNRSLLHPHALGPCHAAVCSAVRLHSFPLNQDRYDCSRSRRSADTPYSFVVRGDECFPSFFADFFPSKLERLHPVEGVVEVKQETVEQAIFHDHYVPIAHVTMNQTGFERQHVP